MEHTILILIWNKLRNETKRIPMRYNYTLEDCPRKGHAVLNSDLLLRTPNLDLTISGYLSLRQI